MIGFVICNFSAAVLAEASQDISETANVLPKSNQKNS